MKRYLILALPVFVIAGCSSSGGHKPQATTPVTSHTAQAYVPEQGADAGIIASHIPGCTNELSGDIGAGGQSGLLSTASCTIAGHVVILDSFSSDPGLGATSYDELYYATGAPTSFWVAFLADQGQTADKTTLQMQLTNDAGGLTQQALSGAPEVASLDAQQQIAAEVAKALGGVVQHAPGAPQTS